jgi:hypothetical protein
VDFSKPTRGLVTPYFPAKNEDPADEPDPSEMFVWQPVLGPADNSGRSVPNPMSIIGPSATMPSLASRLIWRTSVDGKQRSTAREDQAAYNAKEEEGVPGRDVGLG